MGKRSRRRTPDDPAPAESPDAGPPQEDAAAPDGAAAPDAPGPEAWDDLPDFPSSREVEELFGSWEQLWDAAGLYDAPYFRALEDADAGQADRAERRDATAREAARLRTEAERREAQMRELRRQAEAAREKADRERGDLQAERARGDAAERRAEEAERRAAAAERRAADGGDTDPAEVPPEWLAEHESLLAAVDQAERHGEALAGQVDHALEELEERDRARVGLRGGRDRPHLPVPAPGRRRARALRHRRPRRAPPARQHHLGRGPKRPRPGLPGPAP